MNLFSFVVALLATVPAALAGASTTKQETCDEELHGNHPVLCHMLDRLKTDPQGLAVELSQWAAERGLLAHLQMSSAKISHAKTSKPHIAARIGNNQLPVVFAHGMGDSCYNRGMDDIVKHTSNLLDGVYTTCIAIGKNQHEDTTNGYFLNMDASVDMFAAKIKEDPKLAQGFHAIGFSQGNNVIRGYIARYNDPPVNSFLSVNGVNAGEGAVPYCRPSELGLGFSMCDLLMEQASKRAYTEWAQEHSFQANYWRDPRPVEKEAYQTYSQLARWNNEGKTFNQTLKDNWARTSKFVWIMAEKDGMVWPREGEHWGAPDPSDPFNHILPMNETEWYQKDLFGLRTAQEAGKNFFESFNGDHLQFTMEDFNGWVQKYLATQDASDLKLD